MHVDPKPLPLLSFYNTVKAHARIDNMTLNEKIFSHMMRQSYPFIHQNFLTRFSVCGIPYL